ncbi:MAG: phosphoribosyltransferase family protein [Candidatus Binatia bacterium]
MYFASRTEAGRQLAARLADYRYENAVVVALSDGAVLVGQEIAATLHCGLGMMMIDKIDVPGENQTFGTLNHEGGFAANPDFSSGQMEEYYGEFHGLIEQQKQESFRHLNQLLTDGGLVDREMLRHHVVILVSDGFNDGMPLDAAAEFLKPVAVERLIVAAPIASVPAVDRMHIIADEIQCLGVTENYLDTDHYYDINQVPAHSQIVEVINQNVLNWR